MCRSACVGSGITRLMPLRRCWFEFDGADVASGIRGGCGVSALHRADALQLLRASVGSVAELLLVVADIDSRLWTPDMCSRTCTRHRSAASGSRCWVRLYEHIAAAPARRIVEFFAVAVDVYGPATTSAPTGIPTRRPTRSRLVFEVLASVLIPTTRRIWLDST